MADVTWMARPDFPFPQIATGDLDIPVVGQLPAAEPSVRRRFRAESGEDGSLPGSVQEWGPLEARLPVSSDPCLCPSLTESNRRGTGPVCPVWEGWHCEVSPYPDQDQFCDIDGVS
jgi:hypothetical protein